ncbi:AGC kinase [Cyclospora cayetanensis]|uniref:non-specific serine/threonine protein kinase n=1 Tax=Cyclospora cayetanensis TaxID=88456 RepID=A0A1D3D6Q3_9EIME|nr:AGC kinase [Cyclospora cayetanensis]
MHLLRLPSVSEEQGQKFLAGRCQQHTPPSRDSCFPDKGGCKQLFQDQDAPPHLSQERQDRVAEFKKTVLQKKRDIEKDYTQRQQVVEEVLAVASTLPPPDQLRFLSASSAAYGEALGMHLLIKRHPLSLKDFTFIQTLGRGGFGSVYLVQRKSTKQLFALKQVPKSRVSRTSSRERQFAERDCLALCSGGSSNGSSGVVLLQQTLQDGQHLYQLMQFLEGGSLMHYMHAKQRFDEATAKLYIAQLIIAVSEIHKLHYIHRDIKPDNIAFTREGHLKLLDFGLARYAPHVFRTDASNGLPESMGSCAAASCASTTLSTDASLHHSSKQQELNSEGVFMPSLPQTLQRPTSSLLRSICGTPMYTAPEVLLGGGYDFSVDWWSVGVVLFEMLYGGIPFCPPPKFKGDVPQFVKLQVTNYAIVCPLVCDASMRYKRAADILTHPFFKGLDLKTLFTIEQPLAADTRARHIPKQDTNPDDEVDLLFARYPFDRRAEESRPVASQIMNDKRVQAALRAAFEKQPPEKSADSSHTEEAMHGQTDDPLESARDLEDMQN